MNIRPKSAERSEAQLATYLLDASRTPNANRERMSYVVGTLATMQPGEPATEQVLSELYPHWGAADKLSFMSGYKGFLRGKLGDPESRDLLSEKQAAVERYTSVFLPQLQLQETFEDHHGDNRVGSGSFSSAYLFMVKGQPYVARKIASWGDIQEVDKHINAAIAVADIPHMEHVEGISYEHAVTVSKMAPGVDIMLESRASVVEKITKEQIQEFYDALKIANSRNVGVDAEGSGNIFYDVNDGFTAIDLGFRTDTDIYYDESDPPYEPALPMFYRLCANMLEEHILHVVSQHANMRFLAAFEQFVQNIIEVTSDDTDSEYCELLEELRAHVQGLHAKASTKVAQELQQ